MAKSGKSDAVLVSALAAGMTQEQAAKQARVTARTVRNRLADPTFRQQVTDARTAAIDQAVARLTAASTAAATTLLRLLEAESESVRLSAARSILELGCRLRESQEMAAQVQELREKVTALEEYRAHRRFA